MQGSTGFAQKVSSSRSDHGLISMHLSTHVRSKAQAQFVFSRHCQSPTRFILTSATSQDRISLGLYSFFSNYFSLHVILPYKFHTICVSSTLPFRHSSICVLLDRICSIRACLSDSQGRLWLYCP